MNGLFEQVKKNGRTAVRLFPLLVPVLLLVPASLGAQPVRPPGRIPEPAAPATLPPGSPPAAPASEGAPDKDTALLREAWTDQEARRVRGLSHRISRILESPAEKVPLKDSAGRKFDMDYNGHIRFDPLDDNWQPVIPNVSEVAFHLAEADGLRRFGLKGEALTLWKTVRAMALFVPDPPAFVKEGAARATRNINEMRTGDPDFTELDQSSDPYIFFHEQGDETYLLSDVYGWRMRLPGRFQMVHAPEAESQRRSLDFIRKVVHLKQGNLVISVGSDLWRRGWKIPDVQALARIWDLRRSLGAGRKRALDFRRDPHPEGERCVPGRLSPAFSPDRNEKCAVYQTFLAERGNEFHALEFFHLRSFCGFLLEIKFSKKDQEDADLLLQRFFSSVTFSSR